MLTGAGNGASYENTNEDKVLGEFLKDIDHSKCDESTNRIKEINIRLESEGTKVGQVVDESSAFQDLETMMLSGFYTEIDESVQPKRDRGKGRLIAGPGAKIGGIQPRPAELRRTYCKTTLDMERKISNGRKFCMDLNITFISARQREEQNRLRRDPLSNSSLRQQVIALMCRIYIGSINLDVKEETIRSIFAPYGIIRKVDLSWEADMDKHKGFAFVEYEVPDAAQLALVSSNHHLINGRPMKVGRPSNMPQATPYIDMMLDEARKYPRVYVSNIHVSITEDELKSVFEAFGPVVKIELPLNPGEKTHKSYAYIEFTDHKSAHDSILALNRFDIGGQLIRVGPSVTFPMDSSRKTPLPNATALAAAAVTAKIKSEGGLADHVPGSENTAKSDMLSMISDSMLKGVGIKIDDKSKQEVTKEISRRRSDSSGTRFEEKKRSRRSRSRERRREENDRKLSRRRRSKSSDTRHADRNKKSSRRSRDSRRDEKDRYSSKRKLSGSSDTKFEPRDKTTKDRKNSCSDNHSPRLEKKESSINEFSSKNVADVEQKDSLKSQEEYKSQISVDAPQAVSQSDDGSISIKGSEQRFAMMKKLAAKKQKHNVIVMRNMVEVDDIDGDIEEDIKDECSKFGAIESFLIHQSNLNSTEGNNIIKVFVEFQTNGSAKEAKEGLDGRFFAGKIITVELYDAMMYKYGDYSA